MRSPRLSRRSLLEGLWRATRRSCSSWTRRHTTPRLEQLGIRIRCFRGTWARLECQPAPFATHPIVVPLEGAQYRGGGERAFGAAKPHPGQAARRRAPATRTPQEGMRPVATFTMSVKVGRPGPTALGSIRSLKAGRVEEHPALQAGVARQSHPTCRATWRGSPLHRRSLSSQTSISSGPEKSCFKPRRPHPCRRLTEPPTFVVRKARAFAPHPGALFGAYQVPDYRKDVR